MVLFSSSRSDTVSLTNMQPDLHTHTHIHLDINDRHPLRAQAFYSGSMGLPLFVILYDYGLKYLWLCVCLYVCARARVFLTSSVIKVTSLTSPLGPLKDISP